MTNEDKEILENHKLVMMVSLSELYKSTLAKVLDHFPKNYPDLIEKYGSILVNSVAQNFEDSWIFVAEHMQVQTLSREIVKPQNDETKVIV